MNIWIKEGFFLWKKKKKVVAESSGLFCIICIPSCCSKIFLSFRATRYFWWEVYLSQTFYLLTFNSHLVQKPFTSPQNKILPLASIIIHLAIEEADRSVLSLLSFFMHLERYLPFFHLMAPQHPPHFSKIFANKAFRHHHPTVKNPAMTSIHATWFKIVLLSQFLTPNAAK